MILFYFDMVKVSEAVIEIPPRTEYLARAGGRKESRPCPSAEAKAEPPDLRFARATTRYVALRP